MGWTKSKAKYWFKKALSSDGIFNNNNTSWGQLDNAYQERLIRKRELKAIERIAVNPLKLASQIELT